MDKVLLSVALRYRALYLGIGRADIDNRTSASVAVMALVSRLNKNGYCVDEETLHALCSIPADHLSSVADCIDEIYGVKLNWAPLVKEWSIPTGETLIDHIVTMYANAMGNEACIKGTTLPCGHLIPDGTFPIERYNGCPFCGTPFVTANYVYSGQGTKLKGLRLFVEDDLRQLLESLLTSNVPLDATQKDTLVKLLGVYGMPEVAVGMKETSMMVVRHLVEQGRVEQAGAMMKTPADILRYLWYEKTGNIQILEPKTLVAHARHLMGDAYRTVDRQPAAEVQKQKLKLRYDRKTCLMVATWLNNLPMTARQAAENMNPKRGMWVRFVRALRLGEYSRRQGMGRLRELLDIFYREDYATWQGTVDNAVRNDDKATYLSVLKERPGMFARCLFSAMLRYGADDVEAAFGEVCDKLPARLLLSLVNAAELYFDPEQTRQVRPLTGVVKTIEPNKLLSRYSDDELKQMVDRVERICRESLRRRFASQTTTSSTIYIAKELYDIPVSIGDRSTTVQDASCALPGTRFGVEGDAVRVFMQWGKGLHAQHLDMDLSARISIEGGVEECAYYNLTCTGAKHSGDIRSIPEMVGTAEYVELSLPELAEAGAKYVTFTCNAYSAGALSPNLVVGWMNCENAMALSERDGVAYDPSCVQHMVRVSEGNLSKGLVFGVLDVSRREIIWLEMPFTAQTLRGADEESVMGLLKKLAAKLSIGELLEMKARAQHIEIVSDKNADEVYTYEWAMNSAAVSGLLSE